VCADQPGVDVDDHLPTVTTAGPAGQRSATCPYRRPRSCHRGPDRRKRRIDVRRSTSCSSAERSASIGTVVWMYLSALAVLTGA